MRESERKTKIKVHHILLQKLQTNNTSFIDPPATPIHWQPVELVLQHLYGITVVACS